MATTSINHTQRAHALLSASGASRWLNCTPSARLEEEFGKEEASVYAAEGTLAHEFAELIIRHTILKELSQDNFEERYYELLENDLYTEDMLDYVYQYVDYVKDELAASSIDTKDAVLIIEEKVDLRQWIPESFGSCDAIIIADGTMKVMDLKYGKGVPVSAIGNKQLMLYALGAYDKYSIMYDIVNIDLHIVQPRINNINSWSVEADELLNWAENTVIPAAKLAFNGQGQLKAGEWCKFCKVKARCRELYKANIELAKYDFASPQDLLTDDEIADIIDKVPRLVEWANSVLAYATEEAVENGKVWPGHKLVAGRSTRKFTNEIDVANALMKEGFERDAIFDTKLKSLTALERVTGKKAFEALLGSYVVKSEGKPTLVPLSDKRPAIGAEDAINDFK